MENEKAPPEYERGTNFSLLNIKSQFTLRHKNVKSYANTSEFINYL